MFWHVTSTGSGAMPEPAEQTDVTNLERTMSDTSTEHRGPAMRRPAQLTVNANWVAAAARLPGKSLHVALAIASLASLRGASCVRLGAGTLQRYGVADAVYDALSRLAEAGLVTVDRRRGRHPAVTVLHGPAGSASVRSEGEGKAGKPGDALRRWARRVAAPG